MVSESVSLDHVALGGEALRRGFRTRFRARFTSVRAHQSVWPDRSDHRCHSHVAMDDDADRHVPIGRPIEHAGLCIGWWLEAVPCGVVGELYISGLGLARGYLGRAGSDGGAFCCGPVWGVGGAGCTAAGIWRAGVRTGFWSFWAVRTRRSSFAGSGLSLARLRRRCCGRLGFRRLRWWRAGGEWGDLAAWGLRRLVGYVVAAAGAVLDGAGASRALSAAACRSNGAVRACCSGSLPLTPNGKLDRRALPAPEVWLRRGPACRARRRRRSCAGCLRRFWGSSGSGLTTTSLSWAGIRCWRPG